MWTCLCAPALTREVTVDNKAAKSGSNSNTSKNLNLGNEDEVDEESAATTSSTARPSVKASPVREPAAPDTPTLGTSTHAKRGGKKGAGRGRNSIAPTPGERDEKATPRNGHEAVDVDATPVPAVHVNGTATKRGKRGQQKDTLTSSGESDKDPQTTTAAQSDADVPTPRESQQQTTHTQSHHITHAHLAGHGKKKDPSLAELKRRTAAMLDWIERAKEDIGRSSLVSPSGSGSSSPEGVGMGIGMGGPVGGGGGELYKSEVEGLHERLLGWQVEYGAG